MRRRPLTWLCVLLLCATGVFLYIHARNVLKVKPSAVAKASTSTTSVSSVRHNTTTNTLKYAAAALVNTNRLAWRLSNTSKTIKQLENDPHAILLENAFIDTSAKINLTIPKNLLSQGDPGAYVVQARGPISPGFRSVLTQSGATVVSYIPNNSYLVRATEGVADGLMGNPFVQAVIPYEPYYKVQAPLLALADQPLPADLQLNIGLYPGDASATIQQIEQMGGIVVAEQDSLAGYTVIKVEPPQNWTAIAALPGVHIVEPFRRRHLANDLARPMLGVAADSITPTNYMNLYGSNVLVDINDSGIDTNHPDFNSIGEGSISRIFGFGTNTPDDGHGTHVAGIIVGNGDKSMTVTNASGSILPGGMGTNVQFRGKAPLAKAVSRFYGDDDRTLQQTAAADGALISNNSWGFDGDFDYDLEAASYDAATRDSLPFVPGQQSVLYVFSAGNDGGGGISGTITSPGTAKDIMTVGALEELRFITNSVTNFDRTVSQPWLGETDDPTAVPGFSSCGNVGIGIEGTFGRFKPDVVAPGTFVVSCRSAFWDTNAYYFPTNDNFIDFPDFIPTNSVSVAPFNFFVPSNTVDVIISVVTNMQSPPVLPNLPIYVSTNGSPFDLYGSNNVLIVPDPSVLNANWTVEASNTATAPLSYDLIVDVQTTNYVGNYYQVLQNLNDTLGTQPEYYRYESGTSMAAAAISGFLALIQDYFTNQYQLGATPSPALLKAMTVNGARSQGIYNFQVDNAINYQGWGEPDLSNSVPPALTNIPTAGQVGTMGPLCSTYFRDGGVTNALATGDSETFNVTINGGDFANFLPLRVTLAWTDPPADPSAAIKLVNDLELVVTDLDNPSIVYYGNDIGTGQTFNTPETATNPPIIDNINNLQNVFIPPLLDTNYSVTVIGRSVNANAVTEHTNNFVQDFALVISSGDMGEVTDALQVTDGGIVSGPTNLVNITDAATNQILLNQTAGGNTPLLGTNTISMIANVDGIGTNSEFTAGMVNQWHFYVVTNNTTFTNAAFITFGAVTMAVPRMGVFADSDADATVPDPDLDLLVTRSSTDPNASQLLNLDPTEISNCIVGVNGDGASLVTGGTDFVAYTNAVANEVYYIGVKSESHMGIEYGFVPIFTQTPFGGLDQNGNAYVNGLNVPQNIPDGTPAHPGVARVFMIDLNPVEIQNVVLTNTILHQNFGDLVGSITHHNVSVVLNNHDSLPNPPGPYTLIYDDSGQNDIPGSRPSDGPGSLRDYDGTQGQGVWILTEEGTALAQTGQVQAVSMFLQKHQNLQNGIVAAVQPGQWFYDYVNVPNGITNLEIFGTNLTSQTVTEPLPIQMYLLYGSPPTFTDFDFEALLNQGFPLGNEISDGPPLAPGVYWVGLFNPNVIGSVAQNVYLLAVLNGPSTVALPTGFSVTNSSPISIDAVTNTSIFISNTNLISSLNVGMVVQYPRISDLAFTLVSPSGQRILLMENRGGPAATNAGSFYYVTNFIGNISTNGTGIAQTNYVNLTQPSGQIEITYDFFTRPDEMTVYYGTNVANPGPSGNLTGNELFDSGMIGNFTGNQTVTLSYPPSGIGAIYTNLTIIMNQFGNTNGLNDAWQYSLSGIQTEYNYLTFTEDTNLTTVPIKFAIPPFDLRDLGTNFTFSDFDFATNGDYFGQSNIYDPFGGWVVPTNFVVQVTNGVPFTNNYNEVSIIANPSLAFESSTNSSNVLALGYGIIQRTNFVTPFRMVTFSYEYRGPGIAGWWRGEGDARDSSDAEAMGQNGTVIGRVNYPAGEVSQAFEMENNGGAYDFAGTNGYVQIRQQPIYTPNGATNIQSSYLDVGTGSGFTVEGWINPTNTLNQQPLVEWLARVPTNGSDTNLFIRAGPFLYRGKNHYYYMLGPTNWTTSETWAMQLGGHLATVDSADEQNWIRDTFAGYGGRNRNLWIGLTNDVGNGTFDYSSGETNVSYYNWLGGEPTNCDGSRIYTLMFGNTNTYVGNWAVANNDGTLCGPVSNIVYGVVDVTNLQTNGVSFWISVTNVPGTTNIILTNTGCLFANIMDTSNMSHWIYSQPGLVQSNEFQHVALTYDTNSGIANLFYDGTNVASTNFGVFIPKTTGDVLLGKDMSLETNNYFGGEMDEVSIYNRALSDAEILGIYSVSADTTNRLIGKFDPTVTPPLSLAEAQVVLGGMTNTILGENNTWQEGQFSFTTQTNALPMQIMGIEPGMLFDAFSISEAPLGNLYYLPEQALDELDGEDAFGNWTLEIWNTRNNTLVTNAQVISWQLQIVLQTNVPPPVSVGAQEPTTVTVFPGQTVSLAVTPPLWASVSQNTLVSSTLPLNVYFNPFNPPTGGGFGDTFLYASSGPNNSGSAALTASGPPGGFTPGQTYYIGLQNNGTTAATAVFEVSYNITALTNNVPYNDSLTNVNGSVRYFSFNVTSTNAYEATFQLLNMNGNCDLVVSKAPLLPTLTDSEYGSFNSGRANENIYVLTNSSPVPLSTGTWYLGVYNRDTNTVNYTVLAHELDLGTAASTNITLISLTNGVPFSFTAGPGAALTNFFSFGVTNMPVLSNGVPVTSNGIPVTNFVGSIHFQLYNMTGNGDLTVQSNAPPFAPPFFQSSQQPGTLPEFIQIQTNNALTNLAATWYLGVPNETTNLIYYTILAVIDTNNVFPSFPGAEGAGGGALGASYRNGFSTNNTVYYVTTLSDDGSQGSLRDAISSTNRTIVFDVAGIIYLQSPLIITNSYLTIAGQTAPEGGITLAGQTVEIQGAHDVVMRYLRLLPGFAEPPQNLFIGNDGGANDIEDIGTNGTFTFIGGLNYPNAVAFDPEGNLFEGDEGSGTIYEFTNYNGILTTNINVFASGVDNLSALAFDAAGNLYAASAGSNSIYEYTPARAQSTFVTGMNSPASLAFDKYGNLFVGNQANDVNGNAYVTEITPAKVQSTFASGINDPSGLAFDAYGYLYVSQGNGTGTILKYPNTTNATPTIFATGLDQPNGLAFDNDGYLLVADEGVGGSFGNVTKISPSGKQSLYPAGVDKPLSLAFQGQQLPVTVVPPSADTALFLNNASNIVSDHLSIEWSTNNDVLILNSTNADIQWSIISDSIHATDTLFGAASVVETNGSISLHHNLYADNVYANPQLGGIGNLDFVNNVIYNWGTNAGVSDNDARITYTNYLNFVCNYIIASTNSLTNNVAFWGGTTNTWIFQTNNFIDSDTNRILNGANTRWDMFTNRFTETNEFPLPAVSVDEAYMAYEKVLDFAGDSMFRRDAIDTNIVENVRLQDGVIINQPGGLNFFTNTLAYEDTANDGIPDFWKLTFGQILTNAYNNYLPDASGYSELEEYENWLAGPHALTITNTLVGIDLEKLFGKSGNLSFCLTNAIHGTVYLTNVLGNYTNTATYSNSIAIFTPTNDPVAGTNYSGFGSFDVFVTNNDTVGYFGPVTVNVFVSAVPPTYSQLVGVLLPDPVTNNIGANTIQWYKISEPTNLLAATNMLLFAGAPMNMWYSSNSPPTAGNPNDFELLTGSTNGTAVINIDGAPLPPRVIPGGIYYLGIQNTNSFTTNYAVGLAFDLAFTNIAIPLGGNSPQTNTVTTNSTVYYAVTVPPNAVAATNILDFATPSPLELWFNQTALPVELNPPDTELLNNFVGMTPGIGNPILTLSSTPPLVPGQTYYLAVQNANAANVNYGIEVDFEYNYTPPVLPMLASNLTVVAGNTLTVNDTATDTNAGVLVYYLSTALPVNATVNGGGIITWNVPTNEPAMDVLFTLIASNSFTLQTATNSFTVTVLPLVVSGQPQSGTVASNSVDWLAIRVPLSADWATNILLSSTPLPANVLFTTKGPSTNGAYTLMFDETSGTSLLGLQTVPTNIVSGGLYYIGIQNTNNTPINYAFQVNFGYYLPPVLPVISNQVVVPGGSLVVTNTATDPNLVGTLSYALITSPSVSATISTNGVITWNVPAHQPLGHLLFETIVTNSLTTLSATNYFTVTVVSAPLVFFNSIIHTNIGGTNGFLLSWFAPTNDTFKVQETGSLYPPSLVWGTFTNVITYTGPVTPTNGLFTFFDSGSQFPFGPMRVYRLLVLLAVPPNTLTLPNQPNIVGMVSQPIIVTNIAVDSDPIAIVTYSLGTFPAPATNAMMTNGIISWTPGPGDAGGEYKFTTVAMDNGLPPAVVTNSFTVFVEPPPSMNTISSTSTNVTFQWTAPTNDLFQVGWTTNLNSPIVWHTFPQTISSTTGTFTFTDNNRPAADKFYRLIWQPLP
jgi:subtilisin-like proprotein convertase family protein